MNAMQAFNRGLFDFLIATDDPCKQQADKPTQLAADPSASVSQEAEAADVAAVLSQQSEAEGGAAASPAADGEVDDDAAPEHAWTETATKLKVTKVRQCGSQTKTGLQKQYAVDALAKSLYVSVMHRGTLPFVSLMY